MPFLITWTTPHGSEQETVDTASQAFAIYNKIHARVIKLTIRDDHGRSISYDDLVELKVLSESER